MKHELFSLEKASVFSGETLILSDFYLHIYEGEILGVICDSLTEEQTLIDLFRGKCRVEGSVRFSRTQISGNAVRQECAKSFFVVDEHLPLIRTLSVPENICIFRNRDFLVRSRQYTEFSENLLAQFDLRIDLTKTVSALTPQERLLVILLKAYAEKRRVIVLANISETVTEGEFMPVLQLIRKMTRLGHAFLIIDSIDTNIFSAADQVMVVRGGSSTACFSAAFFNREKFWNYMFEEQRTVYADDMLYDEEDAEEAEDLPPSICLEHVSTGRLHDISLSVDRGELLKILCLDRRTIGGFRRLISGDTAVTAGRILISGQEVHPPHSFSVALRNGIMWCPESPYENAVISTMSVRDNLMLGLSEKVRHIWLTGRFSGHIDAIIRGQIGIGDPLAKASDCSPEALQKLVYTRFLISRPSILVLEKPFTETGTRIRETTLEMIRTLLTRGVTGIVLPSTPSTLSLVDGDEIYAKNGRIISEEEMYNSFYGAAGE